MKNEIFYLGGDLVEDKNYSILKPYQGILLFILVVLMMIFIGAQIQMRFGIYGLAITELIILAMSVGLALLLKANLKEVFPIKVPAIRQIIATILMWIGAYLVSGLAILVLGYLFPNELNAVNQGLEEVVTSATLAIAFFITAVMPAICEEALMRGFIQCSFNSFKNKWFIVILVGAIFGILHFDFIRFFPTAILGGVMAYIMVETKNLILPIFFHLINNGLATFVSFLPQPEVMVDQVSNTYVSMFDIGQWIIMGSIIPFIFLIANLLLHKKGEVKFSKKNLVIKVVIAIILAVAMRVLGGFLIYNTH